MSTPNESPDVIFDNDTAIYRPGNGNVINYKRVGGIFYHLETPDAVVTAPRIGSILPSACSLVLRRHPNGSGLARRK